MDLRKRDEYKRFAMWLNDNGYLKDLMIPYELAELYLESDFYAQRKIKP